METTKDHMVTIFKESVKFALLGIVTLLSVVLLLGYVIVEILKIDGEISYLIIGFAAGIIIVLIDDNRTHCIRKINDASRKIVMRIVKKLWA